MKESFKQRSSLLLLLVFYVSYTSVAKVEKSYCSTIMCTVFNVTKASVKCNNSNRSVSQYHAKCYQHSRTKSLFDIQAPLRLNSVTHSDVARRPQNFKKFPIFSKLLNKVKTKWEMFFKFVWPSQF